jgi:hypothetical protein
LARTAITPQVPLGSSPALPITALAAALTFAATDAAAAPNGMKVPSTGRELILLQNTDAAAQTITIISAPDGFGRTGDITTYSVPAGGFAVLGPFNAAGWRQSDGFLYINSSDVDLKIAVLQLPPTL